MKKAKPRRIFGPLFRVCRLVVRATHKRQPVLGMENIVELPAVFIGRHQDMQGPVDIMAWVPLEFRLWSFYRFMSVRGCYRQYTEYTYTVRFGHNPFLSKVVAAIAAPFVSAFMNSMGGIPVYRGRKEIMDTFRLSVEALGLGENILIIPERDYTDEGSDAGDLYSGFVHIAQMYYKATGKALRFYPIYTSARDGRIYVEKPIAFDPAQPFHAERDRIVEALKKELSSRTVEADFPIDINGRSEQK
jgi:hypothetical protein